MVFKKSQMAELNKTPSFDNFGFLNFMINYKVLT